MGLWNLNIGSKVYCEDAACGTLTKVALNSETEQITHLIVGQGLLDNHQYIVPVTQVEDATAGVVKLSGKAEALTHYPEYNHVVRTQPKLGWDKVATYKGEYGWHLYTPQGTQWIAPVVPVTVARVHQGLSAGENVIERGTPVYNHLAEVGKVDHVLIDAEQQSIRYLIVRQDMLSPQLVIPAEMVCEVGKLSVSIDATQEEVAALAHYTPRPAADIQRVLEARLNADVGAFAHVTAHVDEGVVTLCGYVANIQIKRRAEILARSVTGVIDVDNALIVDATVVIRVLSALQTDPRTNLAQIKVIGNNGRITLRGETDTVAAVVAAEQIAAQQAGVQSVDNALIVKPYQDMLARLHRSRSEIYRLIAEMD